MKTIYIQCFNRFTRKVSSMKTYIFARKVGANATKIMEIDKKEALRVMRENRNSEYQLGILTGGSFDTVIKVYGEYAPFHKVSTIRELVKSNKKMPVRLKRMKLEGLSSTRYKKSLQIQCKEHN